MVASARELWVLSTKIEMIEKRFDGIENKLDRNFEEFTKNYATKNEVEELNGKIKDQSWFINRVMYSLLASALAIIIALVSFIYINGIN